MSDPHFDKLSLLAPLSGSDGGTTFRDYSPSTKAITPAGAVQTDTDQSKFYGSSALFNGADSSLAVPSGVGPSGTGDWTIEWWQRLASLKTQTPFDFRGGVQNSPRPTCYTITPDASILRYWLNNADRIVSAPGALVANQWQHIAVCRAAGVTRMFIDGVQQGADYADTNNYTPASGFLGRNSTTTSLYWFHGWQQDFRVTLGVARYTAAFTPPGRLCGTISGTTLSDEGAPAARAVTVFPRLTSGVGVPARSAVSAADGSFSFEVPMVEHTVIVCDDPLNATYQDRIVRVNPV